MDFVMIRVLPILLLLLSSILADIFPVEIRPEGMDGNRIGSIRILDQRELVFGKVGGEHFSEISDLAYWPKRHRLLMVSDEGRLFHFRARFGKKITELVPLEGEKIRRADGRKLRKSRRDSEGLTLDDRGRLYASFEGKPRIVRLSYDGRVLSLVELPSFLASKRNYRGANKELEALTWHSRYGLVTAPEYPLKGDSSRIQTLYALSGKRWSYPRGKDPHSAITALEVLDNGDFLILERAYDGPGRPMVVTLRRLHPDRCRHGLCAEEVLARFDSSGGWAVDNFEGLAKVGPDRFVMISDDNDNLFQKTILIYFSVING